MGLWQQNDSSCAQAERGRVGPCVFADEECDKSRNRPMLLCSDPLRDTGGNTCSNVMNIFHFEDNFSLIQKMYSLCEETQKGLVLV